MAQYPTHHTRRLFDENKTASASSPGSELIVDVVMPNDPSKSSLEPPRAVPHLGIPVSTATVDVRIINTTSYQKTETQNLLQYAVRGHKTMSLPSYAFLITNNTENVHLLFDLGMRKDWQKACPPAMLPLISDDGRETPLQVCVEYDIVDLLDNGQTGITSDHISAVIWSHHHFDHRGDMARFPPSTRLIVGPGLIQNYLHTEVHKSELEGREVIEMAHADFNMFIGGFLAHDAFGDGSFYLLSAPGHSVGHLCALARTSSSPTSTYVFLGGDCAYHCGQFRPSPYVPLPKHISFKPTRWAFEPDGPARPPTVQSQKTLICAGEFIKNAIHPRRSAIEPFYDAPPEPVVCDHKEACETQLKLELFDAHDDVLVCISHDPSLMNVLPFYPYTINDWYKKGCKPRLHWEFMKDFDLEDTPAAGKRTR